MAAKFRYSKRLGLEICGRIAMGESLRAICDGPDLAGRRMPTRADVLGWLFDGGREDFCAAYNKARRVQAELLMDDLLAIVDGADDRDAMALAKLRLDVRRWIIDRARQADDTGDDTGQYVHEAALMALGLDPGSTDAG